MFHILITQFLKLISFSSFFQQQRRFARPNTGVWVFYHTETSSQVYRADQWAGFYMIETSVIKELNCKSKCKGNFSCVFEMREKYHGGLYQAFSGQYLLVQSQQWKHNVENLLKPSRHMTSFQRLQEVETTQCVYWEESNKDTRTTSPTFNRFH